MRKAAEEERTGKYLAPVNLSSRRLAALTEETTPAETSIVFESEQQKNSGCGCLGLFGIFLIVGVVAFVAPWWAILIFVGLCFLAAQK